MRKMKGFYLILVLVFVTGCGCGGREEPADVRPEPPTEVAEEPVGVFSEGLPSGSDPSDYFPMEIGMEWSYQITMGRAEPLRYHETDWPSGIHVLQRGRFSLLPKPGETFLLEMRVESQAAEQGRLQYAEGVRLEIVTDELGVFDEAEEVFWAISRSSRFMAHQVVTYPPDALRGRQEIGSGTSMRLLLFGEKPGTGIGIGREPKDTLIFMGVDSQVPGYENQSLLHFLRKVERAEKRAGMKEDYIDNGFTEDTWFLEDRGLVRLEQKVGNQTSMVWVLLDSD